jgi:hypothetical protein
MRAFCNMCVRETNHVVVAQYQRRDATPDDMVWVINEYLTVKCAGCDHIHFLQRTLCSEDLSGDGDEYDDPPWRIDEYPPKVARRPPKWLHELRPVDPTFVSLTTSQSDHSDETLNNILLECYAALENGSRTLAATGARTALERLMLLKIDDQGSFKDNVGKFIECGYMQSNLEQTFVDALDAGHAAAHRGYAPTENVLSDLFDIIEGIINSTLILPNRAIKVQETTPPRPKRNVARGAP